MPYRPNLILRTSRPGAKLSNTRVKIKGRGRRGPPFVWARCLGTRTPRRVSLRAEVPLESGFPLERNPCTDPIFARRCLARGVKAYRFPQDLGRHSLRYVNGTATQKVSTLLADDGPITPKVVPRERLRASRGAAGEQTGLCLEEQKVVRNARTVTVVKAAAATRRNFDPNFANETEPPHVPKRSRQGRGLPSRAAPHDSTGNGQTGFGDDFFHQFVVITTHPPLACTRVPRSTETL